VRWLLFIIVLAAGCGGPVEVSKDKIAGVFVEAAVTLAEPTVFVPPAPPAPSGDTTSICPNCQGAKFVLEGKKLVGCPRCPQ